jgi:hypothetical protein
MNDLNRINPHLTPHLTQEQIANLLIADPACTGPDANAHLRSCAVCTTELSGLRQSLGEFRDAVTLHAERQAAPLHRSVAAANLRTMPQNRHVALWLATAAALVVAVSAPFGLHLRHPAAMPVAVLHNQAPLPAPAAPHTLESDEALLSSIDQDLSASIPASMEPLADPLARSQPASTLK